jgi:hypothetical protein
MKYMKSISFSVKAITAVVLLALGFSRAAAQVDPASTSAVHKNEIALPESPCVWPD